MNKRKEKGERGLGVGGWRRKQSKQVEWVSGGGGKLFAIRRRRRL